MRVAYIGGAGRLGLAFALWSAECGHEVIISDVNEIELAKIRDGQIDRLEPRVNGLAQAHHEDLILLSDDAAAAHLADLVCIVTGTPSTPTGQFSSKHVLAAAREVARGLDGRYTVINVVSTMMPGETRRMGWEIEKISGLRMDAAFGLTHSPEFVRQGSIIEDFRSPEYMVIGEHDDQAGEVTAGYYESLTDNDPPMHHMSLESAEIAKTGLNAAVVAKVALANELTWLCQSIPGADARDVLGAIGSDARIGQAYFSAGTWPGGPCFPRDTRALAAAGRLAGVGMPLVEQVSRAAQLELARLADLCEALMVDYPHVGILGLAYKPGVALREESQGAALFDTLGHLGEVSAHDPAICKVDLTAMVRRVNLLVLMTCWDCYRALEQMDLAGKCVVDMWGFLDAGKLSCDRYVRFGEGPDAVV